MIALIEPVVAEEYYLQQPFEIIGSETEITHLPPYSCLVEVGAFGICSSDIKYFAGEKSPQKLAERLPLILGHEGVGLVLACGRKVDSIKQGDRVVFIPLDPCGECTHCTKGQENLCQNARFMASTAPGLARTHLVYPARLLIPVPSELDLMLATLTEPLSIAYRTVVNTRIRPNSTALVIGTGSLGFLLTATLSGFCSIPKEQLFFVGRKDHKLSRASGFATPVNLYSERVRLTGLKEKCDFVFECVGGERCSETIGLALELVRSDGQVIILGLYDGPVSFNGKVAISDLTAFVNKGSGRRIHERILRGSSRSCLADYPQVIQQMANPTFRDCYLQDMIHEQTFPLNLTGVSEAFRFANDGRHTQRVLVQKEVDTNA